MREMLSSVLELNPLVNSLLLLCRCCCSLEIYFIHINITLRIGWINKGKTENLKKNNNTINVVCPCILVGLPANKAWTSLLSTVKHGGGSIQVLAAVPWDSLALMITPHSCVMAEVYEAILHDYCSCNHNTAVSWMRWNLRLGFHTHQIQTSFTIMGNPAEKRIYFFQLSLKADYISNVSRFMKWNSYQLARWDPSSVLN